jgi:2-keto-4-pentenoate hydratase/2-oxohepta-3-ene-1,7-dioic acid hydratase in catechol pathway
MRIVRFAVGNEVRYGLVKDNQVQGLVKDPFISFETGLDLRTEGVMYPLDEVRLLAPCLPSKIVCLGVNYRTHAQEMKHTPPPNPLIFLKPSTAVIGPAEPIVLPRRWQRVDYEGELGVVIGKKAKYVPEEKAREFVLGYTCFNDVTERQFQKDDVQWTRGKGFDTFAPVGPWIETEAQPEDLKLETYLNGEVRQSSRTSELIFPVPTLISFISGVMTLLPGDVIATGTPAGIAPMKPGDTIEVRIENIGVLRNPVTAQGSPP